MTTNTDPYATLTRRIAELETEIERYRDFHDQAKVAIAESNARRIKVGASTLRVLELVADERKRQDKKWGEQNHPDGTGGSFSHHDAEKAKAACDAAFETGAPTWRHILFEEFMEAMAETDPVALKTELIQVAAVACSWVEAIERRGK